MAIVEGIQFCIPHTRRRADQVIDKMVAVLGLRFAQRITRGQFLERWRKLRKALFLTPEYQHFRELVLIRCGRVCEICQTATAVHVHHTKPVAYHPRLALVPTLAKGVCTECHEEEHAC